MIRNPDFDTFVCCAVCSKLIPPPPRPETFERIREYKPYKTRYYTHRDILELGADIKQAEADRREAEVQQRIEKVQARLLLQAATEREDAVEDALNRAAALHAQDIEALKEKDEKALQVSSRFIFVCNMLRDNALHPELCGDVFPPTDTPMSGSLHSMSHTIPQGSPPSSFLGRQ
nr:small integral membrane protein 8 isoform X1 [Zootoca vivipara]